MVSALARLSAGVCDPVDPVLAAALAAGGELDAAVGRRAAEVVREWLMARGRTWVAVEFTRERPEPPFGGDAGLGCAVACLPRAAFSGGLDVRGSHIVRLAALDAFLARTEPLKFRRREPGWWAAVDGAGQWEMCRHGDGYYNYAWTGVVDGLPATLSFSGHRRRADVVAAIERSRAGIEQVVRARRVDRGVRDG